MFAVASRHIVSLSFNDSQIRWPYFALFVQNIVYPRPELLGPLALVVTWSVAVEEQFYAIWPVLVRTLSRSGLAWILLSIVIAAPLARYGADLVGIDPYINPLCRFDGMALGSLVALWICTCEPDPPLLKRASLSLLLAAIAGAATAWALGLEHLLGKTFVSVGFCGLLISALASREVAYILSLRWLRHVGRISYGIYLLHLPIATLTASLLPNEGWRIRVTRAILIFGGSIGAATISWYFFESRVLRLKRFFAGSKTQSVVETDPTPALAVDDSVGLTA
jgi:peptidoglycan/LPS O-acetylase OafA/YrhL